MGRLRKDPAYVIILFVKPLTWRVVLLYRSMNLHVYVMKYESELTNVPIKGTLIA